MSARSNLSRHDQLFFILVGIGAAALAAATFLGAHWKLDLPVQRADKTMLVVIMVASFAIFHRFRLLLSARRTAYMLGRAIERWMQLVLVALAAYLFIPGLADAVPRSVVATWTVVTLPVMLAALLAMRRSAVRLYGGPGSVRSTVFLMPGNESRLLAMRLRRSPVLGMKVAGYFGDAADLDASPHPPLTHLGGMEEAIPALANNAYRIVFVGIRMLQHPDAKRLLEVLGNSTASIYVVPEARAFGYFQMSSSDIAGVPLLSLNELPMVGLSRPLKRAFDLIVGGALLLAVAPVMAGVTLAVKLNSPGPAIFRQVRYGQDGQRITIYKFRSMYVGEAAEAGQVVQARAGDARITPVGRWLRRTSLDELPQLLNVLQGSMSLVGPRPHAAAHNEIYRRQIAGYMLRHTVKPGITGWAQVNGLRGETNTLDKMRRRVEYDHEYIQNWSLGFDLRILLMTLQVVVSGKSAY